MDILLDNSLATMYGTLFLAFYGFVIFLTMSGLAIIRSQIDQTHRLPLPPIPPQIDPYEIAYLRGGINEVARSVVLSLMQKGFAEIKTEGKKSEIIRIGGQTSISGLAEIEQFALGWLGTKREPKEVFETNYGLVQQLEDYGLTYRTKLENQRMLTSAETKKQLSKWKWLAIGGLAALGMFKILAAVIQGYSNVFLIVAFFAVAFAAAMVISSVSRITKYGKTYLKRLQLAFDNLKFQAQAPYIPNGQQYGIRQTAFAGVDPLLLSVGVFGPAILAGTVFDGYNQAFQKAQHQPVASGSSCGSGCGSSCSSSGSGSSCGSSCGGCGGGCS